MKRILLLLFCLLIFFAVAQGPAAAETLVIPTDLQEIGEEAFYLDTSIRTVRLPEGITKIGAKAFAGSGVTAVNLPDSLKEIADDAFDDTVITSLTVNEGTYAYKWAISHGYIGWESEELTDGTMRITGYTVNLGTVTIPRQINGKTSPKSGTELSRGLPC